MLQSLKKNKYGISLMLLASILVCLGQAAWKLLSAYGFPVVFAGAVMYALGALCMLMALRHGSLSVVQPMISLSYVLAMPVGVIIFHETVELTRLLGVLTILVGLVLICGGDNC